MFIIVVKLILLFISHANVHQSYPVIADLLSGAVQKVFQCGVGHGQGQMLRGRCRTGDSSFWRLPIGSRSEDEVVLHEERGQDLRFRCQAFTCTDNSTDGSVNIALPHFRYFTEHVPARNLQPEFFRILTVDFLTVGHA